MIDNTSAPPGMVVPRLIYKDVAKAVEWLSGAFGFSERLRTPTDPDGTIHHLQLAYELGAVILTANSIDEPDKYVEAVMVRVKNIDAHCARARQFGARILSEPDTKPFGERQYSAEDLEGHHWAFTESVADVPPEEWGGLRAKIQHRMELLPTPRFCYIQIPATDAHVSAGFYENVFGWNIRSRDSDHPSFDDAAGDISGGWFTDLKPAREAGLLVSIWVNDIDATLESVTAQGGEVVMTPRHDQPGSTAWIAHFRDPAGNLMGLYQESPRRMP